MLAISPTDLYVPVALPRRVTRVMLMSDAARADSARCHWQQTRSTSCCHIATSSRLVATNEVLPGITRVQVLK